MFGGNIRPGNSKYSVVLFGFLGFKQTSETFVSSVADPDYLWSDPGSVSDFWKRPETVPEPDPDPDLNKFSVNFFLEILLAEICPKKFIYEPKS
jgi:hypothetical protein